MSGTENEAVEAALAALAQWTEPQYGDLHAISAVRAAHIAYDAMRPIIAREVIAGVCRREGHLRVETTELGSTRLTFRCGRCPKAWTLPRPRPSWAADGRAHLRPPTELTDKVPSWTIPTPDRPADPVVIRVAEPESEYFVPAARPGEHSIELLKAAAEWWNTVVTDDLRGIGFTVDGQRRAVPAPEPCPFGCGTGPLGRDQLNAHIAQEHPDARAVQSVLGQPDPREEAQ